MNGHKHQSGMASGQEPQIGGERLLPALTGFEPLLGGTRRAGIDITRLQRLLDTGNPDERSAILETLVQMGQQAIYALELACVIPPNARHRAGNWSGMFTPTQRRHAIEAIAEIGSYESLVGLIECLADSHFEVRESAERALRRVTGRFLTEDDRTRIAYRALIDSLKVLPTAARKVIARILATAPVDLVLGRLLTHTLADEAWSTRREAAWVLGALGDKRAVRRLMDVLSSDPSASVRSTAAWALGEIEAPVALPSLAEAAQEPDEVVRAAAIEALAAQALKVTADDMHPTHTLALKAMVASLQDPDLSVQAAGVRALTRLNSRRARAALKRHLGL